VVAFFFLRILPNFGAQPNNTASGVFPISLCLSAEKCNTSSIQLAFLPLQLIIFGLSRTWYTVAETIAKNEHQRVTQNRQRVPEHFAATRCRAF
jgi:hypothetical protein